MVGASRGRAEPPSDNENMKRSRARKPLELVAFYRPLVQFKKPRSLILGDSKPGIKPRRGKMTLWRSFFSLTPREYFKQGLEEFLEP